MEKSQRWSCHLLAKAGQEKSRIDFVHFVERSSAMKGLKNTEKYELDGDHCLNVLS